MRQLPQVVPRAADISFDERLVEPFVEQTVYVFARLFDWNLEPEPPHAKCCVAPTFDVSGVIRLTGRVRGGVVLSLSRVTACRATELLLERPCRYLNDDVADAVRELTNTVAGRAAGLLHRDRVRFGLPKAVIGHTRPLEWPSGVEPFVIEFHSTTDALALELGLEADPADPVRAGGSASPGAVLF